MISRRNGRRLGVSGTDWVKNGDRWQVEAVRADGGLAVRHLASRLHATLPADYVAAHLELGYASTVHAAQGITTDVVHGIVTGAEDRQLLYTMLTRGRVENHAHLVLGSDETRALPSPTEERALTATEVLQGILARDGAAVSATTAQATGASPEAQLHDAVTRYADAVAVAASRLGADHEDAGPGLSPGSRAPRGCRRPSELGSLPFRALAPSQRIGRRGRAPRGAVELDDAEAAYHRNLSNRINARYGEALDVWQERIVA